MIWLHMTSGRGPEECQVALSGIQKILEKEALSKDLKYDVVDYESTDHGLVSCLISIEGTDEKDFAQSWSGVIEWICKSTIRPTHKRKRWFIGIAALDPEIPTEFEIKQTDLKIERMRASGPGGQHVNKTESAIRLTHVPTGLTVSAQEERSQIRNISLAKARLKGLLENQALNAKDQSKRELWTDHNNLERGNAKRTFTGSDFKPKI